MDCGTCTLCCKLANIDPMRSLHGVYCKECLPGKGCSIYSNKPEHCSTFQCAYYQMKDAHIDLRPNNCGVLFEKINDTLILATTEFTVKTISDLVKKQIDFFLREGLSVMLQQFTPHKYMCMMVPGANRQDIIKALEIKR